MWIIERSRGGRGCKCISAHRHGDTSLSFFSMRTHTQPCPHTHTQAGAGSADLTAQTAGSAGVMERSGVQKTGITFGNSGP